MAQNDQHQMRMPHQISNHRNYVHTSYTIARASKGVVLIVRSGSNSNAFYLKTTTSVGLGRTPSNGACEVHLAKVNPYPALVWKQNNNIILLRMHKYVITEW